MNIEQKLMLDIGCGFSKQPGYIGMDKRAVDGVDIVHDIEEFPWPLEDNSCAVMIASHLIEHIAPQKQIGFMNEAWRIAVPGGLLIIATPYAGSFGWFQDPTHIASWNEATPTYFQAGTPLYNVYKPKPWKIEKLAFDHLTNLEVVFKKDSGNTETEQQD